MAKSKPSPDIALSSNDSVLRIPLGYNLFALIDEEDAAIAIEWRWRRLCVPGGICYAQGQRLIDGVREDVFLHTLIMSPPDGMVVDHRNHDGLDCRRSNMRTCTQQQNLANRRKRRTGKNRFIGVMPSTARDRWVAVIQERGVRYYLGCFGSQEDAARAYDEKARELRGEFAVLNFPDGEEDDVIRLADWNAKQ